MDAHALTRSLNHRLGGAWSPQALHASGFCDTWRAEGRNGTLFVKSLSPTKAEVLEAEADGLAALASTGMIKVPAVVDVWRDTEQGLAVLALEWLDLGTAGPGFGARLGEALAALHLAPPLQGEGRYGWHRDNLIGATPQRNHWSEQAGLSGWIRFFGAERLGAMRDRLGARGASTELLTAVNEVIDALPHFFKDGHEPRASLIHGDLWSGNWGALHDGTPVLYDPAVSYSDAEAELAMMELFGAPPDGFWPAYRAAAGLHPGYERRRGLYQLYHLLNHTLLFGSGYARQAMQLAADLRAGSRR